MRTKAFLIFTIAAIFLSLNPGSLNAQFAKGNLMVEGGLGNLNTSSTRTEYEEADLVTTKYKYNTFSFGIYPRIGYFITKSLVIGTTLGLELSSSKFKDLNPVTGNKDGEAKSSATSLDLYPFVRLYFPSKSTSTRFYGQVGGGITIDLSNKTEYTYYNNAGAVVGTSKYNYPEKYRSFGGEVLIGLNHFVSQNVSVNAALGYGYTSSSQTTSYTSTGGNTTDPQKVTNKNNAFAWNVGFNMFIPCKKKKK